MKPTAIFFLLFFFLLSALPCETFAQDEEIKRLQYRIYDLEKKLRDQSREVSRIEEIATNGAPLLMLFGAFCALWAQNTGRNAWGWFFLGAIFHVFTVLFLLAFNKKSDYA